ncbi:hypothetical protein IU469_30040 [Nocardia puris]|uniref:hypothetical protein n=1 Tax=Nocardia puris TaxID=208602 RepID=UPI00189388D2|nr:hypothetical protein [Nocardia puris]MBF6369921.1 hypothetical protein [Nocardia puris]
MLRSYIHRKSCLHGGVFRAERTARHVPAVQATGDVMTSDDPVAESGRAAGQSFTQALHSAQMVAGALRSYGADGRSRAAHDQATAIAEAKDLRSQLEHLQRVRHAQQKRDEERYLNQLRGVEIRTRTEAQADTESLRQAEIKHRGARQDSESRSKDRRDSASHRQRLKRDRQRFRQDRELFELEREIKELRLAAMRRAAGFSAKAGEDPAAGAAAAQRSAAAFAAADASADLSEEQTRDAEAFRARFAEDTGKSYRDTGFAQTNPRSAAAATRGAAVGEFVGGLAEALTVLRHLSHWASFIGQATQAETATSAAHHEPDIGPGAGAAGSIVDAGLTALTTPEPEPTEAVSEPAGLVIDVEPLAVHDIPIGPELEP